MIVKSIFIVQSDPDQKNIMKSQKCSKKASGGQCWQMDKLLSNALWNSLNCEYFFIIIITVIIIIIIIKYGYTAKL